MNRGDVICFSDSSGAFNREEFQRMIQKRSSMYTGYGPKQKQALKLARKFLDKHQGCNKMKICIDTLPYESEIVSVVDVADRLVDDSFYWCGIQSCANNIRRNNTMSLKTYRRNL